MCCNLQPKWRGGGAVQPITLKEGDSFELPKNVFKAPEGKEFKNWIVDGKKFEEGHKLVVTKDIEVKANWEDVKVNPVKKALGSLFGQNNDELDVSDELIGEAVTNDGEYTGPAHNSVVSSDGKVQIRDFKVFWATTDGDTIVNNVGYTFDTKYSSLHKKDTLAYWPDPKFNKEPKMQISWALSGEFMYKRGDLKITIPDANINEKGELKYPVIGYSIPKLEFDKDGSINYIADYGNATLAYYYDESEKATKLINILDLAPGASGTLTLTYGNLNGNYQYVKSGSKVTIEPTIELKYNDEVLKSKDKELFIQTNTSINTALSKYGGDVIKKWNESWGNDMKPKNSEDYWYAVYQITLKVEDQSQTNIDVDLKDRLGGIYIYTDYGNDKSGYKGDNSSSAFLKGMEYGTELKRAPNYSIIGYSDIIEDTGFYSFKEYTFKKADNQEEITWPIFNIDNKKNFSELNKAHSRMYQANVLVKIPYKELGLDKKDRSYYMRFDNGAFATITPKESDNKPRTHQTGANVGAYFEYVPDVEFNAPPGDMFVLQKQAKHTHSEHQYGWDWRKGPDDNFDIDNGTNIPLYWYNNYGGAHKDLWNEYKPYEELYLDRDVSWKIIGKAKVANATYNSKYDDPKNPSSAYGRKNVRYELVDDYLYLADDYTKELTPEDYTVKSVEFNGIAIYKYDYKQPNKKSKADYVENKNSVLIPASLYVRKTSTGEWEKAASFDMKTFASNDIDVENFTGLIDGVKKDGGKILLPEGYTSTKLVYESSFASINLQYQINGTLHPSKRVKDYIDKSKDDDYVMNIKLRNDSTFLAYDKEGNRLGLQGTTESTTNVDRTLELDRINYGEEMYHSPVHLYLRQRPIPEIDRRQSLMKKISSSARNDTFKKTFIIPTCVKYSESFENPDQFNYAENETYKIFHQQNSGTFYDLLPLGVTGVDNVHISSDRGEHRYNNNYFLYKDKDTNSTILKSSYKLIPNWKNSGRTMLVAKFNNAYLEKKMNNISRGKYVSYLPNTNIQLSYNMIYPWDSYKDYGSKIDRNLVAYESGFEKRLDDGLNENLTSELEFGYNDSNPGFRKDYSSSTKKYDKDTKLFTDQEIEWMKDLNPNRDEKRFLYSEASTTVSGDTEANVGLTKHVSTDINPNFTLKSTTKEGGNYQYKIRLQAAHGTSVSNLVFFDSIENYDPLQADEDFGVKRWRGTLSSIDLNHPIMKGIEPKVYVSATPKLDIEKHNDVTDSSVWTLYKEGDDLSSVQAVAIDLRKNKDGSDFKLTQDTAINVYLNMKAPWNLKEKQIDPKAKALNAIYASNTVTTSLDNKSTKLIYTAYTAVNLETVTTETQIQATKKHLDKEGKDIAFKGDDFTFELKDSEGKTLQTKTNDKDGNITFDPIKYNSWDVGKHTYKIVETKGDNAKIDYDPHEEIVKVKVERVGDSELKATIMYDDDGPSFTNQEKKSASLKVIKKESGTDKLLEGARYLLSKRDDNTFKPIELVTNENGESQIVENLEAGTYVLKETKAPQNYRLNTNEIEFEITDNDLGTIVIKEVEDRLKADMPTTGIGPNKFIIISTTITTLAAGVYVAKKKKLNS